MHRSLKFALLTMSVVLLASVPFAKPFDTGTLEGMISSARGTVEDASIEVRNIMSGAMFRTESDVLGLMSSIIFVLVDTRYGWKPWDTTQCGFPRS